MGRSLAGVRAYVRFVVSDEAPQSSDGPDPDALTDLEALKVLEGFLNEDESLDRAWSLNDPRVPDRLVLSWLPTIDPPTRVMALMECHRPAVLTLWASKGLLEEREAVAGNLMSPREVQLLLLADPEPAVRIALVENVALDFDVLTGLLGDGSYLVQEALATSFAWVRAEETNPKEAGPGSEESL